MRSRFVNLTTHTRQRAEREIDAITIRIRAIRTEIMINGQGFRPSKEITRNAVSGFLFGDFFKSEKVTRCRTESCIPPSAPSAMVGRFAAGLRALHPVTFRSCGKSPKARQAFPLHSLRSASALTLLIAELRIVHSRMVHTSVSAPQGAHAEQICKSHKLHKTTRGARNRRNHNANMSDSHESNDKRSRLSTRKADYKGGSPCFLFSSFFKSEKGTQ